MNTKIILLVLFISFLSYASSEDAKNNGTVISRNERVSEMIEGLKQQNEFYDEIINGTMETLHADNNECRHRINELNCSNVEVWENLRRKHSKNITNLQDKMKKHNETIQQILKANIELVEKKNSSLMQLFPEIKKIKNDQEMIDIMLMVIDDTYVRVEEIDMEPTDEENSSDENSTEAVFILSEMEKELDKVGKFIQMRREGPPPEASPEPPSGPVMNETTTTTTSNETIITEGNETVITEGNETVITEGNETIFESNETNETEEGNEVEPPLIDEEIFDKEAQAREAEDEDLFKKQQEDGNGTGEEPTLIADDIPEGKDVKEHDEQHLQRVSQRNGSSANQNEQPLQQHYNLKQLKLSLIKRVKLQGKEMFKELSALRKQLREEQESKLEEISAYERAIFLIHQKHMHQIVQIYKENRNLYVQILEKDDAVMQLDSKINECRNIDDYEQSCEDIKDSLEQFAEDSKSQINFNNAAIKELEKLLEYEDKNVFDPAYEESAVAVLPAKGPMNYYEDYSSTNDGQLVKRTVSCKITECREKRYQSEEKFNLLLTHKYDSLDDDQLLKETQTQVDKGDQLDERFEIKERALDETEVLHVQQQQSEKAKPVEEMHPLQIENLTPPEELEPINDDSFINEMKEKLSSDIGGPKTDDEKPKEKEEEEQDKPKDDDKAKDDKDKDKDDKSKEDTAKIEQQTKAKKMISKKAKIGKNAKKSMKKAKFIKGAVKVKDQELTEPKEVEEEDKKEDSNIFKQAFHYLFGSKNAQGFTEISEKVQKNGKVNGPLDFLAQLN